MQTEINVLFGTVSGHAEALARRLEQTLSQAGFLAFARDMADIAPPEISNFTRIVIITSTYGHGEPPANALGLLEFLQEQRPELSNVCFAVCGLGDKAFSAFAQCGKDFDSILWSCGATRMIDRVDCDDEDAASFETFTTRLVRYLNDMALNHEDIYLVAERPEFGRKHANL